jgi:hypothetical protein
MKLLIENVKQVLAYRERERKEIPCCLAKFSGKVFGLQPEKLSILQASRASVYLYIFIYIHDFHLLNFFFFFLF